MQSQVVLYNDRLPVYSDFVMERVAAYSCMVVVEQRRWLDLPAPMASIKGDRRSSERYEVVVLV